MKRRFIYGNCTYKLQLLICFVEDVTMLRNVIAQPMYNTVLIALKAQSFYSRCNVQVTNGY